jgi:hypothetical protein
LPLNKRQETNERNRKMKHGGYPPGVDYGDPSAPWNGDYQDDDTEEKGEENEDEKWTD